LVHISASVGRIRFIRARGNVSTRAFASLGQSQLTPHIAPLDFEIAGNIQLRR
jgi:hypothetical protein